MRILSDEENSAARNYIISGAVWMCVAVLFGATTAIHLFSPDLIRHTPWLEFGRVRPVHTNIVLYGFVSMPLVGGGLYVTAMLLRRRLYSERLANLSMWLWNLALLGGMISLPLGFTQAREYAELIFPVKMFLVAAFVLLVYVFTMTLLHRQENLLYVSVWYFIGAMIWTILLYIPGNVLWHPRTGALTGTVDSIWLWFYGHNIFGLFLTPLAVGMAYYIVPRVAKAPLYGHTLSLIGFWTLLAFYTHIGSHHLLQAPIPTWLKTISVFDSIAMIIPVMTVLVNLWLTAKDSMGNFVRSVPGKFTFTGMVWYLITCVQGPLQSLPSIQVYTHFNNWVIGHSHIAALGFAGFISLGTTWYILPYVCRRRIFSMNLANLQYWLVLIGVSGFFFVLTIAGLVQGSAWVNGETVYRVLPVLSPYMGLRLMFGVLIILGAFIGLYNIIMTLRRGELLTS
jgi:cytochrome c oxidase cbb3-type subunit I